MTFTKTAEELAARRAKVSEWTRNNQVETTATRNARRKEAKRLQELQDKAEMILAGMTNVAATRRTENTQQPVQTPVSNSVVRKIEANQKVDKLASQADKVLKELGFFG
jgi:hypothetical protein